MYLNLYFKILFIIIFYYIKNIDAIILEKKCKSATIDFSLCTLGGTEYIAELWLSDGTYKIAKGFYAGCDNGYQQICSEDNIFCFYYKTKSVSTFRYNNIDYSYNGIQKVIPNYNPCQIGSPTSWQLFSCL